MCHQKQLSNSAAVATSNLPTKGDFIALKAEIDGLDINKLVNVSTNSNNLKTKLDELHAGQLKTVTLKEISEVTTLIDINQYSKINKI